MEKEFDKWNEFKKKIENITNNLIIKEGEIWWSSIGINTKTESCGKGPEFRRPVLIIKKLSSDTCFVVPLSTQFKKGTWFANYEINGKGYTALLYQLKMMHTNRFTKFEVKLERENFFRNKKEIKISFKSLNPLPPRYFYLGSL